MSNFLIDESSIRPWLVVRLAPHHRPAPVQLTQHQSPWQRKTSKNKSKNSQTGISPAAFARHSHDFASLSLVFASTRILHSASVWKTLKPHTFSSDTHWIRKITIISVFHSATTADGRRKKTHQFLDCQAEPDDGITSPCIVHSVRLTFSHCDPTPRNTAHPATELAIITARENKI